jgi:3-carboxy-cis,cis-muconate cycloisomerase
MRLSSSLSELAGGASVGAEIFSGISGRGEVAVAVDGRAWARALLDVEAALAGALADAGVAPPAAAREVVEACSTAELDLAALGRGTATHGTPVPALLEQLSERLSPAARAQLHRGATSQDILDTAMMLIARRALDPLIADLGGAAGACAELAERHRGAIEPGRTLLQQALPVTFGLKAAGWLVSLDEAAARLREVRRRDLAVQLGGAAGTLASLGGDGGAVVSALARRLELAEPTLPWQAVRLRPVALACALGMAAGVAGKIGRDITLLAQTEVGEVAEGGAGGGSSTLPQKRNPVAAVAAVACSERTPGLVATMLTAMRGEGERAAGAWQAEPETLSDLLRLTGSAAAAVRELLAGLEVDPARMEANLEVAGGLLMAEALQTALTEPLGRVVAADLVAAACRRAVDDGISMAEAAATVPEIDQALGGAGIDAALDPRDYLGSNAELIDRALAAHRRGRAGSRR